MPSLCMRKCSTLAWVQWREVAGAQGVGHKMVSSSMFYIYNKLYVCKMIYSILKSSTAKIWSNKENLITIKNMCCITEAAIY